jgi:VWFA-related protein
VDVAVVNLDVVVRDKAGKLVGGLTRDDFTLYVDGKKAEISNFSVATPGTPPTTARPAPTAPTTPGGPPSPATAAAPAAASDGPQRERLDLVIYVDEADIHPFDRNRLLKQLRAFVDKTVMPGDQVMLVTYDRGLHVRHRFQDDVASLKPALDQVEKESALGISKDLALRQALEQMRDLGCKSFDEAQAIARQHTEATLADVRLTYANLHRFIESLGGMEGRKVMLYVGDGVSTMVGTDVYGMLQDLCPDQGKSLPMERQNALAPLHEVTATANANLVTLYTLEGSSQRGYVSGQDMHPLMSFQTSHEIDLDRQDSLTNLARETGGRAALNGSDFRHDLEQIAEDVNGGYSLGFTPPHAGDGRPHLLKVELKRSDLRAAYRTSYRDRSAQERLEGQVSAALLHGQVDNPLGATVKLGTAAPAEHGRVLVPIQVRVPFGRLAFVPQSDGRHGRVSIVVGSLDAHGGMSPLHRIPLPLRIPDADAKRVLGTNMGYDVKLQLEPGRQRIVFAVRDEVARITSSVAVDLDVDKKGTATQVQPIAGAAGTAATGTAVAVAPSSR